MPTNVVKLRKAEATVADILQQLMDENPTAVTGVAVVFDAHGNMCIRYSANSQQLALIGANFLNLAVET